jgi:hypothetical protein
MHANVLFGTPQITTLDYHGEVSYRIGEETYSIHKIVHSVFRGTLNNRFFDLN